MIDPRTLKAGDVVVFGGAIERLVKENYNDRYIQWADEGGCTYMHEPFWQIAELKRPELPALHHYITRSDASYRTAVDPTPRGWYWVFNKLKEDLSKLESFASSKESSK